MNHVQKEKGKQVRLTSVKSIKLKLEKQESLYRRLQLNKQLV